MNIFASLKSEPRGRWFDPQTAQLFASDFFSIKNDVPDQRQNGIVSNTAKENYEVAITFRDQKSPSTKPVIVVVPDLWVYCFRTDNTVVFWSIGVMLITTQDLVFQGLQTDVSCLSFELQNTLFLKKNIKYPNY